MEDARLENERRSSIRSLAVCAAVMELAFASIHLARSQRDQVSLLLIAYLICGSAFVWLLRWLRSEPAARASPGAWMVVVVAALLFRATLLPLEPASSSDVNRYLWEGLAQTRGVNPYVSCPNSEEIAPLAEQRPALYAGVNHAHLATIYPPFAQLLFRLNAVAFNGTLIGWKIMLLMGDVILAVATWWYLRSRGAPAVGVAAVLWCPLLLLETYEGAHLDIIGVALLAAAIVALDGGRWVISALAVGLAIDMKYLWPGLGLVLLLVRMARERRAVAYGAIALATASVCWMPYRAGVRSALATARMFSERWSFNDPVFALLRCVPGPRWLAMMVVLLGLLVLAGLLVRRKPMDLWADTWLLGATALLLGPVAYPWYFLWIVPALVLRPPVWLVVWSLGSAVLHLLVGWRHLASGRWDPMPWLWVPLGAIALAGLIGAWRRRLNNKPPASARAASRAPQILSPAQDEPGAGSL